MVLEEELRAEIDVEPAMAGLTSPSRATNLRSGKKWQNNRKALDAGGDRDVKMGSETGLEPFQAQPKWEIPVWPTAIFTCAGLVIIIAVGRTSRTLEETH
jgi:hypothetical protein